MKKLILSLTLIWMLFNTAGALQCIKCLDTQCSSSILQNCTSETACLSSAVEGRGPGAIAQEYVKLCAPAGACPSAGLQTLSASTTGLSASASTLCCNRDNCNSANLTFPSAQSVNSLQCYSCDAINTDCSIRIQCKGVENRCFAAVVDIQNITFHTLGCASANLCALASSVSSLPLVQSVSNISCCGTNLCNTAPMTTSTAIYLLLGPLAFSLY